MVNNIVNFIFYSMNMCIVDIVLYYIHSIQNDIQSRSILNRKFDLKSTIIIGKQDYNIQLISFFIQ